MSIEPIYIFSYIHIFRSETQELKLLRLVILSRLPLFSQLGVKYIIPFFTHRHVRL